ncbi:MAG: ATP-binding cassette domain-containing protein [Myxococcaceae bacterium]|nr:ATP-binding cassette domain-containing protein [Myxococcaceae bacterium]
MDLKLDSVSVRFGALEALRAVTATFAAGTHTVICGRAGCGKTTLLKALAGLVHPDEGHVRWGDTDVAALDRWARREAQGAFGMVFQTDALFDSMTVRGNVMLPLLKRGVPEDEATARCDEALKRVGLTAAAEKRPEHLSGGMRKRTGIARAIIAKPEVLFADDPFAGLDPDTERSIAELLLEVSEGRTLISALPDPYEPLSLGQTLVMSEGRFQ